MQETKSKRIAQTLKELREITIAGEPANGRVIETEVVLRGTITFTIPDLLNEGSDEPVPKLSGQCFKEHNMNKQDSETPDATHFVCQAYGYRTEGKGRASRKVLEQRQVVECLSASEAESRAHKMLDGGSYAGVDAFAVSVDEELGDYSDPTFLVRLGDVSALEA